MAGRRESDVGIGRVCFNRYEGVQTLVVGIFPLGKEAHAPNTDRRRRRLVSQPSTHLVSPPLPPTALDSQATEKVPPVPGPASAATWNRAGKPSDTWPGRKSAPGKKCWWLPASPPPPCSNNHQKKRKLHVTIRRSYVILCHILYPNIP